MEAWRSERSQCVLEMEDGSMAAAWDAGWCWWGQQRDDERWRGGWEPWFRACLLHSEGPKLSREGSDKICGKITWVALW